MTIYKENMKGTKNKEIYIAGSISRPCEQRWHSEISEKLIGMGYTTYAPAENKSINDKTNKPQPLDIYEGDVSKLKSCDILLVELHGGKQDGTIWECGWACGWNERNREMEALLQMVDTMFSVTQKMTEDKGINVSQSVKDLSQSVSGEQDPHYDPIIESKKFFKEQSKKDKVIFFYTSNTRLLNNAIYDGIPSESLNHLVLGGFVKFGRNLGSPDEMLKFMEEYK